MTSGIPTGTREINFPDWHQSLTSFCKILVYSSTRLTFMFPELPKKLESSTITQSSAHEHFNTFKNNVSEILLD